jgi:serine phosphatase RsbU (regulator of sigma subunit)/Flp pilus assembly protein TadD
MLSQNKSRIDSLYNSFLHEKIDTSKVKTLISLYNSYQETNPAKGLGFAREALELAVRIKYNKGIINASASIGEYYHSSLNYSEAIKYFLQAAQYAEKENNVMELSRAYNSIGIIYSNQSRNDKALFYFFKVAKIAEENKQTKRLAIAFNNIGIAYKDMGRYAEALKYYEKALAEFEKTNFIRGIASASNNIGILSHLKGEDKKALEYYNKSIENFKKLNDTASEAGIYTNIGEVYNDAKEYKKALEYFLKGLNYAQRFNKVAFRGDAYDGLTKVYANLNQYDKAYYYLKRHIALQDTIRDEEGMKKVQEMEKRMETQKQEREIEYLKQKEEFQKLKVKSQTEKLNQSKLIIYSGAVVFVILLVLFYFLYTASKKIKKSNVEIAEKKREIQDSINYAKHIQNAMLPEINVLQKYFPEGFGLFLPKDIVSGDFYWFNELNDIVYFAAADCTGHGVPGAFMSMIAIDKLNQCLIDKQIENPAAILNSLNKSIKKALKQDSNSSSSKDGLDIALCSFDKNKMELNYSGANRPLWIIRNNELLEFKPNKAAIAGYTDENQKFENHTIKVFKNDSLILFSDGFADQFGGEQKKKFMTKRLKETLISINHLPMEKQEFKLQEIFDTWKGNIEQVDDVMVLGFRV